MKKLLFITSRIPFPLVGGDKIRVFNSLKTLSKKYEIELIYIDTTQISQESETEISRYCKKITPFVVTKKSFIINTLLGLLVNAKPLQVNYYYFKKIQKYIDSIIYNFDAVYCNHIRTTEYVIKKDIVKYVDLVDSIAMNYTKAHKKTSGLWKMIYLIEKKRVKNYEKEIVSSFTKSIIISEIDRRFIDPQNSFHIQIIGNYVSNLAYDNEIRPQKNRICFLGKMDYEPNVSAVLFFAKQIFPHLKSEIKDLEFFIIGAHPKQKILNLRKIEGINVTGFIDNPYNIIQSCQVFVAPMVSGAGIQNKILEAMKMGKCVVTTEIGEEGLTNLQGNELIVCKDNLSMISNLIELLRNEEMVESIGEKAKKYVEKYYSEKTISDQLIDLINA